MTQFKDLAIGDCFTRNGARYVKKSSRTVFLVFGTLPYKVFYFGQKELVTQLHMDPYKF